MIQSCLNCHSLSYVASQTRCISMITALWNLPHIFESDNYVPYKTANCHNENVFEAVLSSCLQYADGSGQYFDYRLSIIELSTWHDMMNTASPVIFADFIPLSDLFSTIYCVKKVHEKTMDLGEYETLFIDFAFSWKSSFSRCVQDGTCTQVDQCPSQ